MYLNGNKSFRSIYKVKLEEYKLCLKLYVQYMVVRVSVPESGTQGNNVEKF